MAIYEYKAYSTRGKSVKGYIEATYTDTALEKLKSRGLFVQQISEVKKQQKKQAVLFASLRKRNATAYITRQMAFLVGAAVPVVSALEALVDQLEDGHLKKMMIDIKEKIKEGRSVSQAFSEYPDYFNRMYTSSLHAGEVSGRLDVVLERLSEIYEKNQALMAKLRSSLTYPVVMLFFGLVVVVFLVSFIIPTFAGLFAEFGQSLPLPTRMLMGMSETISSGWWAILVFMVVLYFIFRKLQGSRKAKMHLDRMALRLPVARKLLIDIFRIRFSYTMALMLGGGVGIIEALKNTQAIFKNTIFKHIIGNAAVMVEKGEPLSRALSSKVVFNSSILGMIRAGEMSDRVPQVLEKIGRNTEIELEEKVKSLTALLEPVIILVLGIFVGFVVLAIMLPIFQVNQLFM